MIIYLNADPSSLQITSCKDGEIPKQAVTWHELHLIITAAVNPKRKLFTHPEKKGVHFLNEDNEDDGGFVPAIPIAQLKPDDQIIITPKGRVKKNVTIHGGYSFGVLCINLNQKETDKLRNEKGKVVYPDAIQSLIEEGYHVAIKILGAGDWLDHMCPARSSA